MTDFESSNVVSINFGNKNLSEQKRGKFDQWLKSGTVCVLLDARSPDVKVPPEFKNQSDLRLNFCYEFHIADFSFNNQAVWGTLSFASGLYFCQIPWSSIYGMYSAVLDQDHMWHQSSSEEPNSNIISIDSLRQSDLKNS